MIPNTQILEEVHEHIEKEMRIGNTENLHVQGPIEGKWKEIVKGKAVSCINNINKGVVHRLS